MSKVVLKKHTILCAFLCSSLFYSAVSFAQNVQVHGLFKNSAVVSINGKQSILKVGKKNSNGIHLISATSKEAVIDINGAVKHFNISRKNSNGYVKPIRNEVRLQAGHNNHFFANGKVNGFNAHFLVDTGASTLAINKNTAARMGITKRDSIGELYVNTANSRVRAYAVTLKSVTVGSIKLNNIRAVIMPNDHPKEILLGNSFLSKCNMKVSGGVLVLTSKL